MILLLLVSAASSYELQYTDDGTLLLCKHFPISYTLVTDNSPIDADVLEEVTELSFSHWDLDGTKLSFDYEGVSSDTPVVKDDGINYVFFRNDWPYHPKLGLTTIYALTTGEVYGFDIEYDASGFWSTEEEEGAYDFENSMTHEIGHVLALGHSEVEEATMWWETLPDEISKRTLHADDHDGIMYLYQGAYEPDDDEEGKAKLDGLWCNNAAGPAGWMAIFSVLLATVRRRY
ncbi:MAG: matrixin family metalloprotease [Proteobacteria bacterium]|jgi:hypothetical protein|nr:matrixin family metalloprotease [Pseudomonadota bacterium]